MDLESFRRWLEGVDMTEPGPEYETFLKGTVQGVQAGSFSMLDLSPGSGQGPAGWRHVSRETVLLKVESYIEDRDADFVL